MASSSILIADTQKSSIVMTSEIFKDKIPGSVIHLAATGAECLEKMKTAEPDMIVVDFSLPDADGVTLTKIIKKDYMGPVLITAFPDKVAKQAISDELFAYSDCSAWLPKPVQFEKLATLIEDFLIHKKRLLRRFDHDIPTHLSGNGSGRGKKLVKVKGKIINVSAGGARIELDDSASLKSGDDVTIRLEGKPPKGKKTTSNANVRATIAWVDKDKGCAGISFGRLPANHTKILDQILRSGHPEGADE